MFAFLRKGILWFLLSILITCISLTSFLSLIDKYYQWDARAKCIYDSPLITSDCIATSSIVSYRLKGQPIGTPDYNTFYRLYNLDLIQYASDHPAVKSVFGFEYSNAKLGSGKSIRISCADKCTYDILNLPLNSGRWFSDEASEDGIPQAVVSGGCFADNKVGDIVELVSVPYDYMDFLEPGSAPAEKYVRSTLRVRIIGKVDYPYQSPENDFYPLVDFPYYDTTTFPHVFLLHNQSTLEAVAKTSFRLCPEGDYLYVEYNNEDGITDFQNYIRELHNEPKNDHIDAISSTKDVLGFRNVHFYKSAKNVPLNSLFFIFLAIAWAAITVAALQTIRKNNRDNNGIMINISNSVVIRTTLFISAIGTLISFIIFLIISFNNIIAADYPSSVFGEFFISKYFLSNFFSIIFAWIFLSISASFLPIRSCKKAKRSVELSTQSFIYKEAEYFDAYDKKDFEAADYSDTNQPSSIPPPPSTRTDIFTGYEGRDFEMADRQIIPDNDTDSKSPPPDTEE